MPTITDTITTHDGTCPVTLATPDGDGPWPGVVMYPDAGSRRPVFDQMAQKLADYGYAVLVPDVYYRQGEYAPFDLNTAFSDPDERARVMSMMSSVTPDKMADDAVAFFDYLESRPEVSGTRFGTTGYCMGGRTSLVVAGRVPQRVAAAMSFHGGGLASDDPGSPHLLADQITAAVYVAGAEDDGSFTPEQAETLDKALTAAGVEHTIETYPAAHGFAVSDHEAVYDPDAAQRHWQAMERFFGEKLG
ncbi:dienelactone hydrolase family protein [Mycobacterium yunnanensis]|uniref:Dienelactone hydrolase family protein n=1 Tax=Mycobacterium yunnanensis TaxID=368477 RepID=A0A9X2Z789_9MYCO|nr:dienelactone hydrolase family protein [Mycobacterium yunnanensis]MCV7423326.1 dienelactone hydrolase family protein [Mycobacterium yunnanensis]